MTRRLAVGWPQHHWTWLLRTADRSRAADVPPADDLVFASAGWNLTSNVLSLPRQAAKKHLDVLVTQNFAAPTRTPQVTVIFDVIFESNPEYFTRSERAYLSFIKPLLRWSQKVVTISESSRDQLSALGYLRPWHECTVVPCGVDERFFQDVDRDEVARVRSHYRLPDRFVLYVGRLNARKNLGLLIEAASRLRDTGAGLVIVGNPDGATEDYPAIAERFGIGGRTQFLGSVPDADLVPLYSAATVSAYLSRREGFGLPVLEAMACGTPVVASDESALREVGGDVPIYVDPSSASATAEALDQMLASRELRQERSARGRIRARQFTWDRSADSLVKVIESAVVPKS